MEGGVRCRRHLNAPIAEPRRESGWHRGARREGGGGFYASREWRRFRFAFLAAHPFCAGCLRKKRPRRTKATQVDHILPRRKFPGHDLDPMMVQPLCDSCHSRKTSRERRGEYLDFRRGVVRTAP